MANASDCVGDVVSRLDQVPELKGRVYHVISDQELLDKTKGLLYTCAAVIYGGLQATGEGTESYKRGISCSLSVDVLLFFRSNPQESTSSKIVAVSLLDDIRQAMRVGSSPSGHVWRFNSERAIEIKSGLMGYLQNWTTPIQMV